MIKVQSDGAWRDENQQDVGLQVPSSCLVPVFLVPPQEDAPSSDSLVPGQFPAVFRVYEPALDTIPGNNNVN